MRLGLLLRASAPLWACKALLIALLFSQTAFAFPEMVRHGYVNCTSCHVSPSGGGVMSAYGRELSKEVLSTWGKDGENKFAYFIESPEWLQMGGDFRTVEVYRDSPQATSARLILMQADLEAAATYKKFTLDATFGHVDPLQANASLSDHFISRRHYLIYRPTDELSFRTGKFFPAFGINIPEHVTFIRRGLLINDQGTESYNLEGAWIGEQLNLFLTGIFGRPDSPELKRDTGASVVASVSFAERYKTGVSYFYGRNDQRRRHVFGPFGILGFSPHFFLLTEWDIQGSTPEVGAASASTQWGFANYQRLDYEFIQGFHVYLTQELSRSDFKIDGSVSKSYGLGIQFFPRPHFELNLSWQIQTRANVLGYTDYGLFLFHFYP